MQKGCQSKAQGLAGRRIFYPQKEKGDAMKRHAIRSRVALGTVGLAMAGLAVSGVALASTPSVPGVVTGPRVYYGYHNAAVFLPFKPNMTTVGSLSLPAGSYTVTAKAWLQSRAGTGNSAAFCKLTLGGSSDQLQADAQDGNGDVARQPVRNASMFLTLSGTITSGSTAKLSCGNLGGGNTYLQFIKITAIKLGALSKTSF